MDSNPPPVFIGLNIFTYQKEIMISLEAILILRLMISIIICDAFFSLKGKKPQGVGVDSNPPGPYRLIYLYLSKRNNDFTKSDFYSKTHDFYHNLRIIFFFSHFPQQLVYLELKLLPVKLLFLRYHFIYHFRIISYILTSSSMKFHRKTQNFMKKKCQPFGLFFISTNYLGFLLVSGCCWALPSTRLHSSQRPWRLFSGIGFGKQQQGYTIYEYRQIPEERESERWRGREPNKQACFVRFSVQC